MKAAPVILDPLVAFAEDARAGLCRSGQKELPSKYLYDEVGSALFDAISVLPEYGLTRADERLLRGHADEIAARFSSPSIIAELGSGSGRKTVWVLEALTRRQRVTYHPIELSATALESCERQLDHLPRVSIVGFESEYLDGLRRAAVRREPEQRLLVLFLGSSIGNFDREASVAFLRKVRDQLEPGDGLLLGTDLEKPVPQMLAAYDDPLGVTAAFNLNVLARINRELGGEFELSRFEHVALWNGRERRIEMHLRSKLRQQVAIRRPGFAVNLAEDETIWTENSHKFTSGEVTGIARRSGFDCREQWVDTEWPFAESLLEAV